MLTLATLCAAALTCGEYSTLPKTHPTPEISIIETGPSPTVAPAPDTTRVINLAICLDTSGSMQGLIDAARQKIWEIVNDFALAQPTPDLRVALLTFGNNGHNAEDGWVLIETDFTEDLDLVSQKLFALTTNGGNEYVGRVVDRAAKQLTWHPSEDAMKLIIVAGNESADQDPTISFRTASRDAIARNVMVNSIYCGDPSDGLAPAWREVAQLADGHYAAIDHNNGTIVISTPFDDRLSELSTAINATFISYTPEGQQAQENQWAQDANAAKLNSATVAARAQTKGCGSIYRCSWDLVDACKREDFKLEDIAVELLPEEMQNMTQEERLSFVEAKATERIAIQDELTEIGQKRQAFITEEMKKLAADGSRSFDEAIRKAIRAQAESRGFTFPTAETASLENEEAPESGESAEDC